MGRRCVALIGRGTSRTLRSVVRGLRGAWEMRGTRDRVVCTNLTRRAKHRPHAESRQASAVKIFHFTEIRNCGILLPSRPKERGDRTSSRTRVGVRWTRQRRRGCDGQGGQRIEPNPVSSMQAVLYGRRLCPAKPLGRAGWLRTAKPCGPGCRCYSQAFAKTHRPNRARCIIYSRSDGDKRNSSPGRARHTLSTHCAGKAGCFPAHLWFSRCAFACAHLRTAGHGCQPAPGLPCALFTEEGEGREQNSGVRCRENADPCVI